MKKTDTFIIEGRGKGQLSSIDVNKLRRISESNNKGLVNQEIIPRFVISTMEDIGAEESEDEDIIKQKFAEWIEQQNIEIGPTELYYFQLEVEGNDNGNVGGGSEMTPLEIKIAYESNNNTNAFTDTDKNKLDGLENFDDSEIYEELETKVDKFMDYGLSQENFTSEEKTKLSNIEENKFRGKFLTLESLNLNVGFSGAYAYLGNPTEDDKIYIWDDDDSKWVVSSGSGTSETPATIKQKLLSNADTNNYSNADKILVDTITNKVNKDGAKVLTDQNYTLSEKNKLSGLQNYTLPQADNTNLGGVYFKNVFNKEGIDAVLFTQKSLYDFLINPGETVSFTQTLDISTLFVGYIKTTDGLIDASLTAWRSTDFIPCVIGNVFYYSGYAYSSVNSTSAVFAYDSGKNYLGVVLDTTSAVSLTDQQVIITNTFPTIAYIRSVYRNNAGDSKVLKKEITIPSPTAKRIVAVTDTIDPDDKERAVNGYAVMRYPLNKSWGAIGHSVWYYDEVDGIIGIQSLVKKRIIFSDYAKYAYGGNSLTGSSTSDTGCILELSKTNTWTSKDIYTYDSITNDFKLNKAIGTSADFTGNTGVTTYYGALRVLHEKLKTLNPNYRMICGSPLQRNNAGYTSTSANTLGFTLKDYTDALLWVRNKLSWSFVDQFNDSGINLDNLSIFTSDGLHPNNLGYERYYRLWVDAFKKI